MASALSPGLVHLAGAGQQRRMPSEGLGAAAAVLRLAAPLRLVPAGAGPVLPAVARPVAFDPCPPFDPEIVPGRLASVPVVRLVLRLLRRLVLRP